MDEIEIHPSIRAIITHFEWEHLPGHTQWLAKTYEAMALKIARNICGPEATVLLRKLLESRDAALRCIPRMPPA